MKRNRLHLIILCVSLCCLGAMSARAEMAITVSHFNRIEYQEALASIGRLEVSGDNLYLVGKDGERMGSAKIERGLKIEFGDVDDELLRVGDATEPASSLTFSVSGSQVRIGGLRQPTMARVFSIGGRLVMTAALSPTPEAQLSLAALPKGIYILQINTSIYKIQKK